MSQYLIDTKSVKGLTYLQLFKYSMEYNDQAREIFVRNIFSILQVYLSSLRRIDKNLLYELIDFHLLRMNKLIIDYDDFELFKKEMDFISRMILRLDPKELLDDVIEHINRLLDFITNISESETKEIEYLYNVEHELLRNFNSMELRLNEFKTTLLERSNSEIDKEKIKEEFDEIQAILDKYEVIARLHRTFFLVGSHILFYGQNKDIKWIKYIKELWEHTRPEDASAHYLNKTPVCFDPLWLTYLLVYGGKNDFIWLNDYDFEWGDYHGIENYVYQYWLFLMNKWSKNLPIPEENSIKAWKSSGHGFKLEFWRDLCNDFLSYHKDKVKENSQKIMQERLYEGLYAEEQIEELEKKFDNLVNSMRKALGILQRELNQPNHQ